MRAPLACLLLSLPFAAPAQAPGPVIRTTTAEVLLDFVVRDKHGRMVRDLRPEEVEVLEDGVAQKLRHLEFFEGRAAEQPAALPEQAVAGAKPAAPTAPGTNELRDISVVSVVVGNMNPEGRTLALNTIRDFIKNELRPNTYVGVFRLDMSGMRNIQGYTSDPERISTAMKIAVSGTWLGRPESTPSGPFTVGRTESSDIVPDRGFDRPGPNDWAGSKITELLSVLTTMELHDVYHESMRELTAIRSLVQAQAAIPGRKVVLLFSGGISVHTDSVEVLRGAISAANRSNVTIYAVDTRGFEISPTAAGRRAMAQVAQAAMNAQLAMVNGGAQAAVTPADAIAMEKAETAIHLNTQGNMLVLAEGTGGALLPRSDLRAPLRRAMEEVRSHYELTYSPANTEMDGRFRTLLVKVARPGTKVFARSGYYALPSLEGRPVYPFEAATLKAINTRPLPQQLSFRASALRFRPGPDRNQYAFACQVAARDLAIVEDKNWAKVHVAVTALVKDERGLVVDKISRDIPYQVPASKIQELRRGVVSFHTPFQLPPGRYTLEVAVLDRESLKVGVRRAVVQAGSGAGLAVSDVALVRRVDLLTGPADAADPLQIQRAKVEPELSSELSPEPGAEVRFYGAAYPAEGGPGPLEMTMEIVRDDGAAILRSPASAVPLDENGTASALVSVPAEKLPPGQYLARMTFRQGAQTAASEKSFAIAAAGQ